MGRERSIIHVDVDAFFASVEQALDPSLAGKPVIIGGEADARGVVSTASYEARRFGVHSAMPTAQARRLCPHGVFLSGNYAAYRDFSDRIYSILTHFAPLVQTLSLDDFYLDVTGCERLHGTPWQAAEKIKLAVKDSAGLNVSLGVGSSRVIAKIASDFAKPNGIACVWRGYEAAFLRPMPVETLPGVGPSTARSLSRYNISTVGDLARIPVELLEEAFGQSGRWLWERAHGLDDSAVEPESGPPKSIGHEHTFERDVSDREEIDAMLNLLAQRAAKRLREEGMLCRRVTAKVRFADFRTVTGAQTLAQPADEDHLLYQAASQAMHRLLKPRLAVRLVGVSLSGLIPAAGRQADLFADAGAGRRRKIYAGLDKLRQRFGFDIVATGAAARFLKCKEKP